MSLVPEAELASRVADVPNWEVVEGKLRCELQFKNFSEAFGFMTRVALVAERLDHHPDWSNSWNKVTIEVVSHAEGGITEQCLEFATRVSKLLG